MEIGIETQPRTESKSISEHRPIYSERIGQLPLVTKDHVEAARGAQISSMNPPRLFPHIPSVIVLAGNHLGLTVTVTNL